MYIYRELLDKLKEYFGVIVDIGAGNNAGKGIEGSTKLKSIYRNRGLIVSGIVGCGKTTLIKKFISQLPSDFEVFSYSGDDVTFRQNILNNSKYILDDVRTKTTKKVFVFVDEVQKCEEVFDAIKMVFDEAQCSFIVSGSNPAYLSTVAKRRLQRRADQFLMLPISLSEIAIDRKWIHIGDVQQFQHLIWGQISLDEVKFPKLSLPSDLTHLIESYMRFGGLPLALTHVEDIEKLREIRIVVERGFELFSTEDNSLRDTVSVELAHLNAKEFTYQNIFNKTRLNRRDSINEIIDSLINRGYLFKKKPILFLDNKTSYLSIYSFVDPGIVSYLTADLELNLKIGPRVESYVHARLASFVANSVFKSSLSYYKPYILDTNDNVKYQPGEIDFILTVGSKNIPMEVKSSMEISKIDTTIMKNFMKEHRSSFGVIIYGGVPYLNKKEKLLYWPYWMI